METQRLFDITGPHDFHTRCLDIFSYQYRNNPVYHEFCSFLGRSENEVNHLTEIPFLPISFFKSRKIFWGNSAHALLFTSSGTSGTTPSKHYVKETRLYETSFLTAFELFYGPPKDYCILALLPSYLERNGSSLVYMVDVLIRKSRHPDSGFYLNELDNLKAKLVHLNATGTRVLLIGVSFALLDFAEQCPIKLSNTIIMETGGMKGRRRELVRAELHDRLQRGFGVDRIHSEYGMTELLSQAYSQGFGKFRTPPWMQVLIRDPEDPLSYLPAGSTGGLNIIDLANVYSCPFIATQDLGKISTDGSFEVLGRFDHSDVRGCNLMML